MKDKNIYRDHQKNHQVNLISTLIKTINKLTLYTLTSALLLSCSTLISQREQLNIVHWNIKELSSQKLRNPNNTQVIAVQNVLKNLEFNVLSINELQYDLADKKINSLKEGMNAELLASKLGGDPSNMAISFNQANTGNNAKKYNGKYLTQIDSKARSFADQVNFGIFPGQYSSALLSYHPIKEEITISDLKWKDFNKKVNLSRFRLANKKKIPKDIELFDKSFTDSIIEFSDKEIHIITLHAVPAYHFGNKKTPNYYRNRDQLRFLEWYITGGTDIPVKLPSKYAHIKPLSKDDRFIIVGDFNASIYDSKPGSDILRRIFKQAKLWIERPEHTHEAQHFGQERSKLLLDYIAYRGLRLRDAGIYYPPENEGSCLKIGELPSSMKPKGQMKTFSEDACFNEDTIELKKASDHFPIWAKFTLD